MRATRRTIRTAAIATGAIAALAVPTTAAFADTPPAPHSADGATAPGDQTDGDRTPDPDPTPTPDDKTTPDDHTKPDDRTKPDEDKDKPVPGGWESKGTVSLGGGWTAQVDVNASARSAKAQLLQDGVAKGSLSAEGQSASTRISGYTFTLSADGNVTKTGSGDDKDKPVPGGWVSKGTVSLGHGWTAKVDVNASARSAKAQLLKNGVAKGSLKAYIKPASTKIDGCTFTLTADGTVTKTGTPTPPKPKPQPSKKRTFVREYQNLGKTGFDAKVYKTKAGYEADMIAPAPDTGKKTVWDTLKQTGGKAAYGQHNGAHFVLNPDGTMKGWVEGRTHGGGTSKPTHPSTKVPQGGVKAGADGVGDTAGASHDTPLVAAGGGMAALGAAGLGFAMYRRKQNNQ
ncbi:hypothetical protein [Streptomyces sp. NRRL B-1347]|uniref:hypothetical protein n=1 Tax=Streptomyces sp. NRRL B-1347 TaxID=1476877 RepID=UPI0004C7F9CD|nr:hypothetical protein [Streptomyces sp. NRRL B-1347]